MEEREIRKKLTQEEYHVLREKGTEAPFTGKYYKHKGDGAYYCKVCESRLFDSKTKFDSGTGWPSFSGAEGKSVRLEKDYNHGMVRTEVVCAKCGSHLGHVFDDGPKPSGKRYCINSVCLEFKRKGQN